IGAFTFAGSLGRRYDLIGELLNFGAFLGFTGVNLAAIRQFYFLRAPERERHFLWDFAVPGLCFLFCLGIWWGLGLPARTLGGLWFTVGLGYTAVRSRGVRLLP